jgi:type VI secretion system protein ImpF
VARTELERNVQPSLFDRLTDLAPKTLVDSTVSREDSIKLYRAAVQRDVEMLLNTRRTMMVAPAEYGNVAHSVYEYGLPDTTARAVGTSHGRETLIAMVRDTLQRFEPRLTNIRVKLTSSDRMRTQQIRFAVEATLRMDPTPEQVVFDSVLEITSGTIAVGNDSARAGS